MASYGLDKEVVQSWSLFHQKWVRNHILPVYSFEVFIFMSGLYVPFFNQNVYLTLNWQSIWKACSSNAICCHTCNDWISLQFFRSFCGLYDKHSAPAYISFGNRLASFHSRLRRRNDPFIGPYWIDYWPKWMWTTASLSKQFYTINDNSTQKIRKKCLLLEVALLAKAPGVWPRKRKKTK